MFSRSIIDDYGGIPVDSRSLFDDSRVMLQLIVIIYNCHIIIVQTTDCTFRLNKELEN